MSWFTKIIPFLLFYFFAVVNVNAESKVVYLDIDFVLSNTNVGKKVFLKLKENEDLKFNEFNIEEKKLKEEENKILASKNIISKDQLNENIKNFQDKLKKYKNSKSQEIDNLKKIRNKEILELLNLINPKIEKYMKENSISILIDKKNIFIADKNYDITNDLIKLINQEN